MKRAILLLAVLGLTAGAAGRTEAGVIVTIQQVGSNVDVTGSGSLNLTALTLEAGGPFLQPPGMVPFDAEVVVGATAGANVNGYSGISGPTNFGSGISALPNSGSGSIFGVEGSVPDLLVPDGYTSGSALGTSTDTYSGTTLSGLGLMPGTYTWNWGSGATADSFTVNILSPTAVPEPSSIALLGIGAAMFAGYFGWRRRRLALA